MKQTKDSQWYQRVHSLHLSSQGKSVPELTALFARCADTIRKDLKGYNDRGFEGLKRPYSPGSPKKMPCRQAAWEEFLHQSPSQVVRLETAARNWNQALLVTYLRCYHDITVTRQAVAASLKHHGVRLNRGERKVTVPDPLYTVKRDRIDALKKAEQGTLSSHDAPRADHRSPPKRAKLVFFDSTDLHWGPAVGVSDGLQGDQLKIESPGKANPWYALFGSLVYPDGTGLYTIHERKRHQAVRAPLELLIEGEPDTLWFVVMDHASAHTTPKLDAFWAQPTERICPVPLPTYSPPLNLMERLWRVMRGHMTRNQFYQSLKELAKAVVEWFEKLPLSRVCSLMGIDETQLIFI